MLVPDYIQKQYDVWLKELTKQILKNVENFGKRNKNDRSRKTKML